MNTGRIPFGLRSVDQQYVDVQDVPRGLASGCICPSCGLPLAAKQGTVKQWHFAHHVGRSVIDNAQYCEYSFYVSVAHMVRQFFKGEGPISMQLPRYALPISLHDPLLGKQASEVTITDASQVTLDTEEVDTRVEGQAVDVSGTVRQARLLIGLDYPGRAFKMGLASIPPRTGVLCINLKETHTMFWQKASSDRFSERLHHFVFDDATSKCWLYHPHQAKVVAKAREQLHSWMAEMRAACQRDPLFDHRHLSPPPVLGERADQVVEYVCRICQGSPYPGTTVELNPCSQCHSHMYRTVFDGHKKTFP